MTKSRFDFKEKNLGVNILLVSTFWDHILVPNLKNIYIYIYFGPYHHSLNGNILHDKLSELFAQ